MIRSLLILFLGIACLGSPLRAANAAPPLTGIVSSDAEGPMEGVLVSAKKMPGTMTFTVVSDSQGRYIFPIRSLGSRSSIASQSARSVTTL